MSDLPINDFRDLYRKHCYDETNTRFFQLEQGFDHYGQSLVSTHCNATDVISSKYCLIHPWVLFGVFFMLTLVHILAKSFRPKNKP